MFPGFNLRRLFSTGSGTDAVVKSIWHRSAARRHRKCLHGHTHAGGPSEVLAAGPAESVCYCVRLVSLFYIMHRVRC